MAPCTGSSLEDDTAFPAPRLHPVGHPPASPRRQRNLTARGPGLGSRTRSAAAGRARSARTGAASSCEAASVSPPGAGEKKVRKHPGHANFASPGRRSNLAPAGGLCTAQDRPRGSCWNLGARGSGAAAGGGQSQSTSGGEGWRARVTGERRRQRPIERQRGESSPAPLTNGKGQPWPRSPRHQLQALVAASGRPSDGRGL